MTTPNSSSVQQASDWCDANQDDNYQDYVIAASSTTTTTTSSEDDD